MLDELMFKFSLKKGIHILYFLSHILNMILPSKVNNGLSSESILFESLNYVALWPLWTPSFSLPRENSYFHFFFFLFLHPKITILTPLVSDFSLFQKYPSHAIVNPLKKKKTHGIICKGKLFVLIKNQGGHLGEVTTWLG